MNDKELTYGIDMGAPNGDKTALSIKVGDTVYSYVDDEAEAILALMARREALKAKDAWSEGFNAGWAECKDPDAFVNDVWDAKTPNPYAAALTTEATQGGKEAE